jgi:hypothetical protein
MRLLTWIRLQWDRVAAATCLVLGIIVLILGWIGVSGTVTPADQLPYIASAGVGGLVLIAVAATMWLSADLQDEWRKLDGLEAEVHANTAETAHLVAALDRAASAGPLGPIPAGPAPAPAVSRRQATARPGVDGESSGEAEANCHEGVMKR